MAAAPPSFLVPTYTGALKPLGKGLLALGTILAFCAMLDASPKKRRRNPRLRRNGARQVGACCSACATGKPCGT